MMFQYRKRYGLHAMSDYRLVLLPSMCFNTASGMDCMQFDFILDIGQIDEFQYRKRYGLHAIQCVTPDEKGVIPFQYRKRYGLHAISWELFI